MTQGHYPHSVGQLIQMIKKNIFLFIQAISVFRLKIETSHTTLSRMHSSITDMLQTLMLEMQGERQCGSPELFGSYSVSQISQFSQFS